MPLGCLADTAKRPSSSTPLFSAERFFADLVFDSPLALESSNLVASSVDAPWGSYARARNIRVRKLPCAAAGTRGPECQEATESSWHSGRLDLEPLCAQSFPARFLAAERRACAYCAPVDSGCRPQ